MAITGDQLRMVRGALRMTVREFSELAGIDKMTVVRIEAGGKAHSATAERIKEAVEALGFEFVEPVEGARGPGVCLKWGSEFSKIGTAKRGRAAEQDDGVLDTLPWSDDDDGALSQDIIEEREYWRDHPERWAALSEDGRALTAAALRLNDSPPQA